MGSKSRKKLRHKPSVTKIGFYSARACYASPKDLDARIPELQMLHNKTVAVFGLGCLGAPSVLEFARAGVGFLHLIDYDFVDPGTSVRWPLGFSAAGEKKIYVLSEFIRQNYPYIQCDCFDARIGGVPNIDSEKLLPNQQNLIDEVVAGADLIYDSTAEWGVQHFLSDQAYRYQVPYIALSGTWGAWGGRVVRIIPNRTGCWSCYRLACKEGAIPEPPYAPDEPGQGLVQPVGCADPTFTGAGFDMLQIAIMGVRMAVSTLCEGASGAYPAFDWDAVHIGLRAENGTLISPKFDTYKIAPSPGCPRCHGKINE
ncbi:MAG: ThiF family adenylyltransferase [Planctomycetota bacterium]